MSAGAGTAPQTSLRIAVVGMAARFPGAADVDAFWQNLLRGLPAHQAIGPDPAEFDAEFFGIGPDEATCMDPQHRMFLECCWHALEAAGYDPRAVPGVGAVFGGCSFPAYLVQNLVGHGELIERFGTLAVALANDRDALTARTAYLLDLRGPCLTVQAFSATGLAAVHLAAQSLLVGECDLALAGAASVRLGELSEDPVTTSTSGVCVPLDARADGALSGDGVAVVVLRRLDDAVRDGDHVHALLAGTAVTNEGGRRPGFLAPGTAKAEGMAEALAVAGLAPHDLGYVEAQAMGAPIGDAIELAALDSVFAASRPGSPCRLGAVAANVGHLDAAAGMAGLVKAILMVEHGWIPPQPGFRAPAAALARSRARFMIPTRAQPWAEVDAAGRPVPRRAGVNSFGLGGTNVHVVVCQAPPPAAVPDPVDDPHLFVLSARDDVALRRAAVALRDALSPRWRGGPTPAAPAAGAPSPADVAFTLQAGRAALERRAAFVARTRRGVLRGLHRVAEGMTASGEPGDGPDAAPPAAGPAEAADGVEDAASLALMARRWLAGGDVDWPAVHRSRPRRRVPLPGYPFDRRRFWADPGSAKEFPDSWHEHQWSAGRGAGATPRRGRGA